MSDYDFLLKFLVIGEAGCGKSCILHRFIEKKFPKVSTHTIGVEFGSSIVNIGQHFVKLQVWDTAGQERFRSITRSYYRGAAGAILVFDVTNRSSFNTLTQWLADAKSLANPDIVIILVGNKIDLAEKRQIEYTEVARFTEEHDLVYVEVSAFTGSGIEDVFLKCARTILTKIETGVVDPEKMGSGIQYGNTAISRTSLEAVNSTKKKFCC